MFASLFVAVILSGPAPSQAPTLPDTPQGRVVRAYLEAFNSGDEKTMLAAQDRLFGKALLARRDRTERAAMYQKMWSNFGALTVRRVARATALTVEVQLAGARGVEPVFVFDFEESAPFKLVSLGVEVEMRGEP